MISQGRFSSFHYPVQQVMPSELDLRSPQERQGLTNIFNVGMDKVVFNYNQGIHIPIQSHRQVVELGSRSLAQEAPHALSLIHI